MTNIISPSGLGSGELKASYWYVTHRILLRRASVVVMGTISVGLLFYGLYGLVDHYVIQRGNNLRLEAELAKPKFDYNYLAELNQPRELEVKNATILRGSESSTTFITEIFNPNEQWEVESFDYYYDLGNNERTATRTDFILPLQNKYALSLNFESAQLPTGATIKLENIKWKKVADYKPFADRALMFDFQGVQVASSQKSGLSGDIDIGIVSFEVLNKSAFNYANAKFIVLLYSGNNLVGTAPLVLTSLMSNERQATAINFVQKVGSGSKAVIIPDINILNDNSFKGFDIGSGEFK